MNNGDVDLDRSRVDGESVCYSAVNPFHVQLLKHDNRRAENQLQKPKKRRKSPSSKESRKADRSKSSPEKCAKLSSQRNCKYSVKLGKFGGVRCSPDGKRRRRSGYVEPMDLHSAMWHNKTQTLNTS